jgi:CCR4-NOT transcription complex subunit 1
LSRILDVAHDLKAITTILDARPFSFVIDLAVLAAHREFLYLEKWLNDKASLHLKYRNLL